LKISEETFTQFYAVFNSISIQKSKFANPKPNDPETITPEEKNEITSICDSIKNLLQWAKEKYPSIKQDFELDIKTTLINKNRGKVVEHLTKLETHLLEVVKKVN